MDELYADVFARTYGDFEYIGLRYFNVFGRRQDPHGAYAAVIPLFVKKFMNHEAPNINGDGEYSRDFTYIDNVILMNMLAMTTTNPAAVNQIYNTAYGERTTLNQLVDFLREFLGAKDSVILGIEPRMDQIEPETSHIALHVLTRQRNCWIMHLSSQCVRA